MQHVSDSGLQKQVRRLEVDLGVRLFESDGRNVKLTPAGVELSVVARKIVQDLQSFREQATRLRNNSSELVRISCYPVHVAAGLADVVARCEFDHPEARFELDILPLGSQDPSSSPVSHLLSNDVEFAVSPYAPAGTNAVLVGSTQVVVALPIDHPLRFAPSISLDALKNERVYAMPKSIWSRQRLDNAVYCSGVDIRLSGEATAEGLLAIARAGIGCAVLGDDNYPLAHQLPTFPRLLDHEGNPMMSPLHLLWRTEMQVTPLAQAFIDMMADGGLVQPLEPPVFTSAE
jgi:LysR family transcriptional activator of glutamate synthase operon